MRMHGSVARARFRKSGAPECGNLKKIQRAGRTGPHRAENAALMVEIVHPATAEAIEPLCIYEARAGRVQTAV